MDALTTYSAQQIASYLLTLPSADDNDVSNLKLQKLCYYAQGLVTSMRGGEPLFHEEFSAWDHGPVVPDLYHRYKEYGSQPIPVVTDFDEEQIDAKDRTALDDIYDYYGQFSAWRLRNMTHEEKPWIDAYNASSGSKIPLDKMIAFFAPQIDEEYVSGLYGKAQ
ncbi:Panacea domain-containing protein [Rhizobium leguminosarum]|uniref:Panacea domain-containing protein n=1 Tax=Rhizobium leguminosarum TaxID=384 RepID=UPI003F95DA88